MPEIGTRRTSSLNTSQELLFIHDKVIPAFLEQAADDSRPVVSGWCIDNPETQMREQAVGINDETGAAELHVVDLTAIPHDSDVGKTALAGANTSEFSIFSDGVIRSHLCIDSPDIVLGDGLLTPTLTFGVDDSDTPYVQRTRLHMNDQLRRENTYHKSHRELRQAMSTVPGGADHSKDEPLGKIEAAFTANIERAVAATYAYPFELRGDPPRFHSPLRFRDDYRNQQLIAALAESRHQDALVLSGQFEDKEAAIVAASLYYVDPSIDQNDKDIPNSQLFATVADFWEEAPDAAINALIEMYPDVVDGAKTKNPDDYDLVVLAESIVIGALQDAKRGEKSGASIGEILRAQRDRRTMEAIAPSWIGPALRKTFGGGSGQNHKRIHRRR